jgi:SIR2-like domain
MAKRNKTARRKRDTREAAGNNSSKKAKRRVPMKQDNASYDLVEPDIKRTFVLGAGMSVSSGVPAMNGLAKLIFSGRYNIGKLDDVGHFAAYAFPGLDMNLTDDGQVCAGPNFQLNLEELMTAIDARSVFSDNTGTADPHQQIWNGLYPAICKLIGVCLTDLVEAKPVKPYFVEFARQLGPGDVVITFNYDSLCERACDEAHVLWAYPAFSLESGDLLHRLHADRVNIIKLHGSVDWREGPGPGTPLISREKTTLVFAKTVSNPIETLNRAYTDPIDEDVPWLIPPSFFKSFPVRGLTGALWLAAYRALINTDKLHVIGYSLPRTDFLARWLLREGVLNNSRTGRNLVETYLEGVEEDAAEIDRNWPLIFGQLTDRVIEIGSQSVRKQWDAATIPVTVIDPNPEVGARFRELVTPNIDYVESTAEAEFQT